MATASNDSSRHRDPVVDANPDLTRKRQRFSEEALSATSPSSNNSVVVEAIENEASGPVVDSSDLILEHGSIKMEQNSNSFLPLADTKFADESPIEQTQILIRHLDARRYLTPKIFQNLTSWLSRHIEQFQDDSSRHTVYLNDQEFFGGLGQLMCNILSSEDLFTTEAIIDFGQVRLTNLITTFLRLTHKLSTCIVACLPDVVTATIARRDSGQTRGQQRVDLLWHVQVIELVLDARKKTTLIDLQLRLEQPQRRTQGSGTGTCLDAQTIDAILHLLQRLCQCHRDIALTWPTIGAILGITQTIDLTSYECTEQFMEAAHRYIHPTIREKHPRALPDGFHEKFVTASQNILETLLRVRPNEIHDLYHHFVQSDGDALLPQSAPDQSWTESLRTICHHKDSIAIELLTTCWVLEALKSFIFSDIMDVRGCGIIQLGKRLVELHRAAQLTSYRLEHPVVQFVARFLRSNEFTKYIFGPNSHANLISHSQNIFGFLAATYAYTDVDTDIIWNACTTSVEAEFVKASFDVFVDLIRHLEWERLLHLASKYIHTAPEKLGKDAVDSLEHLLKKMASMRGHQLGSQGHLATAFISVDILKQHYARHESKASPELCQIAMAELTRYAYHDRFLASDQIQILERCIPDLVKPSEHALESAVVVVLFLKHAQNPDVYNNLASPSIISAVAAELIKYIDRCRETPPVRSAPRLACISHRIEVVLRLMAISDFEIGQDMMGDLFIHCFGGLAVDTMARNDAWARLRSLVLEGAPPYFHAFIRKFLTHLFRDEVPRMALQDFSPPLMDMLYRELVNETQTKDLRLQFDRLLDLPVWSKLVEVAELACEPNNREIALTNLSSILFDMPYMKHPLEVVRSTVETCHTKFIRERIDRLRSSYALRDSEPTDAIQYVAQQLDLLNMILHKSKAAASKPNLSRPLEICLTVDDKEADLVFTMELYIGSAPKQKAITVRAASTTTLADLLTVLPGITKSTHNRIIVKGRELNQETEANRQLIDIDLQPSCLMAVCPKYSFDNIEVIFTFDQVGTVERELREHYERLEILLHGPLEIAHKVSLTLAGVVCHADFFTDVCILKESAISTASQAACHLV
jgi:ubiquitin carboxyl-terminal hydrolase 34